MFTFTKKADYALLALSFLASKPDGERIGPARIAAYYEIPVEMLAKVMQTLAKAALVDGMAGPTGGYRLIREPINISVRAVVEAVDGPLAIAQCWETSGGCPQESKCHLRGPLARIQSELARLLSETSLADVMRTDYNHLGDRYADSTMLSLAPVAGTNSKP
jgi:Rrf2 family protein